MVPVSLAGLVSLWVLAVVLIGWATLGGPDVAGVWGLLASAAAASWTVLRGLAKQHDIVVRAFEMGREVGSEASVHQLGVDR